MAFNYVPLSKLALRRTNAGVELWTRADGVFSTEDVEVKCSPHKLLPVIAPSPHPALVCGVIQ